MMGLDVLQVLDSDQVTLVVTSPLSPGVIRPPGVENNVHVFMPMPDGW